LFTHSGFYLPKKSRIAHLYVLKHINELVMLFEIAIKYAFNNNIGRNVLLLQSFF